jgi:hypothetical protein
VGERDAIGRVYIERLRLGARGGAGGGIAHVADADVAVEVGDGTLGEHVRHHPVVLVQAKVTIRRRRHNASSVLPPVLQRQQRLKEGTGGRAGSCIASYAAHSWRGSVYGDLAARIGCYRPAQRTAPKLAEREQRLGAILAEPSASPR